MTGLRAVTADQWPLRVGFESVSLICRAHADNSGFVALYRAMCTERSLLLTYRSKTSLRSYAFSPHTLVETGSRPHFRGYAADPVTGTGKFIDLVPMRIAHVGSVTSGYISGQTDLEWNRTSDMTFTLCSDVPVDLREAIALEYALDRNGSLTVPEVRRPLERYVERHFLAVRAEGRDLPIFYRRRPD